MDSNLLFAPEIARLLLRLSLVGVKHGLAGESEQMLRALCLVQPDSELLAPVRAICLATSGRLAESLECLEVEVRRRPHAWMARAVMSNVLELQGEAEAGARVAAEIFESDADPGIKSMVMAWTSYRPSMPKESRRVIRGRVAMYAA